MSGNIYCFWKGGTPPSPWAKKTYWDGSYVKLSNTQANHGVTGGAGNHTHTGSSNWSISQANATVGIVSSSITCMNTHTHSAPSSVTVSNANNDPSYYCLELIYADCDSWESTDRTLPAGAVILSQATIAGWSSISRFTAADGRLIKLGTAGTTGGRDEHTHDTSGTLGSGGSSIGGYGPFNQAHPATYGSHTHTFSVTTAGKSIWPKHVKTRLYQVDSATDRVEAGAILFFDATPSANWEAATSTFDGCFICSNDKNPTQYGSNSHDHLTITGTSSNYDAGTRSVYGGEEVYACPNPHSHTFSFSLNSATHEPEYVYLVPYRLKNTLMHINIQDKTYSVDIITKKIQNKTVSMSTRLRAAHSAIYTPDILVKKVQTLNYNTDLLLKEVNESSFDIDARILGRFWSQYKMGLYLIYNAAGYGMTLRLVKPYGPNDTVINTLYHSWIDQLNKVSMKMDSMVLANRVEYATDLELDNRWGRVLDLPRLLDEGDTQYRKRLQAATKILTGCGTKANCEEVLSFLVDHPDSANIVQDKPGKIRIYWKTDEACRRGKELEDLINRVLPKMVAGGVQYSVYHPFADYQIGLSVIGPIFAHYNMDMLLQKQGLDLSWTMRTRIVLQQSLDYETGLLLKKPTDKLLYANLRMLASPNKNYQMDLLLQKAQDMDYEIDILLRKLKDLGYDISMILQKRNISKAYAMDLLAKKTRRHFYSVNLSMRDKHAAGYGMGIKVVSS